MESSKAARSYSPDKSLQVWQRGTLLTVLRTEEIRRKLDRTCTPRIPPAKSSTPKPSVPQPEPSPPASPACQEKRPLHIRAQLIDSAKLQRTQQLMQLSHARTVRALDAQSFRQAQQVETEEVSQSLLDTLKVKELQSNQSHMSFLRRKALNAAGKRKVRRAGEGNEYAGRLEAYVEKTLKEESRVERLKEALSKSMEELRRKREKKEKGVESRRRAAEMESELRLEPCKAKETQVRPVSERPNRLIDSSPADLARVKRIQAERAAALLSKQVYDWQRLEDLKRGKEAAIALKQEEQRERMLAMERHWRELERLKKKPELARTRRLLRALGVRSHSP